MPEEQQKPKRRVSWDPLVDIKEFRNDVIKSKRTCINTLVVVVVSLIIMFLIIYVVLTQVYCNSEGFLKIANAGRASKL